MTHDHRSTDIHRAELDREIETIRTERLLATPARHPVGALDRVRRGTGRALIAAGTALVGREATSLRTHRA
jgi:hypothetical protein